MPWTAQEISDAGKIGLDYFLRNSPIDQIDVERPFYKALNARKVTAPGAKQYIVEQLRVRYQSNFQWFNGSQVVTYNKRQPIEQAQYPWRSAHDGFALSEDQLVQNGIMVDDDGPGGNASKAEAIQLVNILKEHNEALKLGFQEKFSQALNLDGTQSADALTGRDALVSLTPTTGTVGGIDRANAGNAFWRNYAQTGLTVTATTGNVVSYMETAWRAVVRNGGRPDYIDAGSTFLDGLRDFALKSAGTMVNFSGSSERSIEVGTSEIKFHGVPVIWNPEFDELDSLYAPATPWKKRMYIHNLRHLKLRPIEGQDMLTRKPPRAYDKYEWYWGLTWRGALTLNRANSQAVLAVE